MSLSIPCTRRIPCSLSRTFTTTTTLLESKKKRKTRLVRKKNLEKHSNLIRESILSAPDAVLGYSKGKEKLWESSLLKSLLLDRKEVWGQTVTQLTGGDDALEPSTSSLYNFGLNEQQATTLLEDLPTVSAYRVFTNTTEPTKFEEVAEKQYDEALSKEDEKVEKMKRIISLRNANSKGIEVENTRRIVKAFGRDEKDTGSPEVQAAILTARIHSLHSHLTTQPRDIQNKRPLRSLVQQRAKMLKYLRSLDVVRYEACLGNIGVEARAVEGEVIVRL